MNIERRIKALEDRLQPRHEPCLAGTRGHAADSGRGHFRWLATTGRANARDRRRLTQMPALTTSLDVARVFEGKEHKEVLDAIRNLEVSQEFSRRNFALSEWTNKRGKTYPMVEMTQDGFAFLANDDISSSSQNRDTGTRISRDVFSMG